MRSSRRWLFVSGLIIGVLVIVTVVLALATSSRGDEPLLPEDTPEGAVQRFLLAVRDGDYQTADSYLSSTIEREREYIFRPNRVSEGGWKATLEDSVISGDEATVDVVIDVFRPSGPFSSSVSTYRTTFYLKKEAADWRIISPVDLWWLY
jgi:hypothetical protein